MVERARERLASVVRREPRTSSFCRCGETRGNEIFLTGLLLPASSSAHKVSRSSLELYLHAYDVPPTPLPVPQTRGGMDEREGRAIGFAALEAEEAGSPVNEGGIRRPKKKQTSREQTSCNVPNSKSAHGRPRFRVSTSVPGFLSWRRGGLS
jgi:hypothetical protein